MRKFIAPALMVMVLTLCSCSFPFVTQAPLQTVPTNVGTLYAARPAGVTVVVHDARPDAIVLGGLTTPGEPDRVLRLYAAKKPGAVADAFKAATTEAVRTLGYKEGTDLTLEVTVQKFLIDTYRASGFSTVNCIGYGEIETVLKSSDGTLLRTRLSKVVYWEDSTPVGSFDEIVEEAISRIYAQAAWESTVRLFQEQFASEAGGAALDNALRVARGTGEEVDRREALFWIGLVGKGDAAAESALLDLFRASKEQNVAEASAEAIGMVDQANARAELEAVLSGSKKIPIWEIDDTECVWYLVKALYLLGTPDVSARIPAKIEMRVKLTDLVVFLETGAIPKLTARQQQDVEAGKLKLK